MMKRQATVVILVGVLLTTLLTVSCGATTAQEATYDIAVEGEGNDVIAASREDEVIFDVSSRQGIGAAAVAVITGEFPATVALSFHLRGLEELRFSYGETEVLVTVSSSQGNVVRESVSLGSEGSGAGTAITPESPYWMAVDILQGNGSPGSIPLNVSVIEVKAPEEFLQGAYEAFQIRWIDFYR